MCDVMRISCLASRASAKKTSSKYFGSLDATRRVEANEQPKKNIAIWLILLASHTVKKRKKIRCRREAKRVPDYARSKIVVEGHEFASVERSTGIVGEFCCFFGSLHAMSWIFFSFCKCGREFRKLSSSSSRSLLFCFARVLEIRFSFSSLVGFCCCNNAAFVSSSPSCARFCMIFREFADEMKWAKEEKIKFISGRSSPFHTRVPFFFRACCCALLPLRWITTSCRCLSLSAINCNVRDEERKCTTLSFSSHILNSRKESNNLLVHLIAVCRKKKRKKAKEEGKRPNER